MTVIGLFVVFFLKWLIELILSMSIQSLKQYFDVLASSKILWKFYVDLYLFKIYSCKYAILLVHGHSSAGVRVVVLLCG